MMFFNNQVLVVLCTLVVCAFCGLDLTNYKVTWDQDFTTMKSLNVTPWGPGSTWIAHKPDGEDWVNFMDPKGPYLPFNIGDGQLTIRAQKYTDGKYYGGMLSSVDSKGKGFSQKWGYFEILTQLPAGPSTWPAFWLLDVQSLVDRSNNINSQEIDIFEEYSNGKEGNAILRTTLHYWVRSNSSKTWGTATAHLQCGMTNGFHTYGIDIQPDFVTFYYDRLGVWQYPNQIPGTNDKFDREYFVMVNLAPWDDFSKLDGHSQDMLVKYVRVWQGSGGSKNAMATDQSNQVTYPTAGLSLTGGQQVNILNAKMTFTTQGNLEVTDASGKIIWQSNTNQQCATGCIALFQNDGNFVFSKDGKAFWASNTWNNNMGMMVFQNTAPHLQILDALCKPMWSTA